MPLFAITDNATGRRVLLTEELVKLAQKPAAYSIIRATIRAGLLGESWAHGPYDNPKKFQIDYVDPREIDIAKMKAALRDIIGDA